MLRIYSKKFISTIVAGSIVFSLSTTAVYAAPNSNNIVTTGRTELNVATGVIIADKVPTLAHGATEVTLTGTVVIDGPKLVLLVNGKDVSNQTTLVKIADKTWTYEYKTTVGDQIGNVSFSIGAYTIYANGKPAGQVHTTAASTTQTVHVPFVKSYDYTNLNWTAYDRSTNEFTFSYNLVKIWDDGVREEDSNPVTANVSGTETYHNLGFTITPPVVVQSFAATEGTFTNYNRENNAYDLAFDLTKNLSNGTMEITTINEFAVDASKNYVYNASFEGPFAYSQDFSFTPPTVFRDFTFSTGAPVWTYNQANNTYSVSFGVSETWSNGATASETITLDGLAPGATINEDVTISGVTHTKALTVPAAPAPVIPSSVTGTIDISSIQSKFTGNGDNVQESYTLTYTINGTVSSVNLSNNFTKNGTGFIAYQDLAYNATYNGQSIVVNYTLPFVIPTGNTNGK